MPVREEILNKFRQMFQNLPEESQAVFTDLSSSDIREAIELVTSEVKSEKAKERIEDLGIKGKIEDRTALLEYSRTADPNSAFPLLKQWWEALQSDKSDDKVKSLGMACLLAQRRTHGLPDPPLPADPEPEPEEPIEPVEE